MLTKSTELGKTMRHSVRVSLALSLCVIMTVDRGIAFESVTTDKFGHHRDDHTLITSAALTSAGYSASCIASIANANVALDRHDFAPPALPYTDMFLASNPVYLAAHHLTETPPMERIWLQLH